MKIGLVHMVPLFHSRERVFLCEIELSIIARRGPGLDLDEAGFGARGDLAGKPYSVTHGDCDLLKRRFSLAVLI